MLDEINFSIKINAPDGLNLVLFVVKEGYRVAEEAEVFQGIKQNLQDNIEEASALVITCCENKSTAAREDIVKKFHSSKSTVKLAEFMKKGIYTVGFPDLYEKDEEDVPNFQEKIKKRAEITRFNCRSCEKKRKNCTVT